MEIKLSDIQITDWNPRKNFDPEELTELQASIEQYGILEPLIVRPAGDSYELVAGERRYRAAVNLGLETVPVVIKDLTDAEVHEIMLIENLQRSSLEPLEEAHSMRVILDQGKVTESELAAKLGKSQAWVANRLRLLKAPGMLKDLLISREITSKHVIAALPYAKYPVIDLIIRDLKEKLEQDGQCSVKDFNEIIRDLFVYRNNNFVLELDDLNWDYRQFKEFLDFSKCEKCKHVVKFEKWSSQRRYCPNQKCWLKIIGAARVEHSKKVSKSLEEMAEKGLVDTSELRSDEYSYITASEVDLDECKSCESFRKSQHGSLVCLNPDCYRKKQRANTRARNTAAKIEKEQVWKAIDTWIESDSQLDARWMLRCLIFAGNEKITINALSKWGKLTSTNPYMDIEAIDNFVSSIPEDEVVPAVVRVLCACRLEQYQHVTYDQLEKFVPAAAEYYVPLEASE